MREILFNFFFLSENRNCRYNDHKSFPYAKTTANARLGSGRCCSYCNRPSGAFPPLNCICPLPHECAVRLTGVPKSGTWGFKNCRENHKTRAPKRKTSADRQRKRRHNKTRYTASDVRTW